MMITLEGCFDASVKDNKAIYTWTYSIYDKKKGIPKIQIKTESGWDYSFNINNYEAEYMGLISLLDHIKKYVSNGSVENILIKGDCRSVLVTVNSKKIRQYKHFYEYVSLAREIKNELRLEYSIPINLVWVPRRANKLADKLCKVVWEDLKNNINSNGIFGNNQPCSIQELVLT